MKTNENDSFHQLIHDIRSGLSPILTYAQLIALKSDKPSPNVADLKKLAMEIENSVRSLAGLLDKADDSTH